MQNQWTLQEKSKRLSKQLRAPIRIDHNNAGKHVQANPLDELLDTFLQVKH